MKIGASSVGIALCLASICFALPRGPHGDRGQHDCCQNVDTTYTTEVTFTTTFVTIDDAASSLPTNAAGASSKIPAPGTNNKAVVVDDSASGSSSDDEASSSSSSSLSPPAPTTTVSTAPVTQQKDVINDSGNSGLSEQIVSEGSVPQNLLDNGLNPPTYPDGAAGKYTSAVSTIAASPSATSGPKSYNGFDGTMQALSLEATNRWRGWFGASAIPWNLTLEQQQLDYSWNKTNYCWDGHGFVSAVGQNIFDGVPSPTDAINGWGNEYKRWQLNSSAIGDFGHFSALVWKEVTSFACVAIECTGVHPLDYPGRNTDWSTSDGMLFICDYYPRANMMGMFEDQVGPMVETPHDYN